MSKRAFHIFNPETDYALAMGRMEYSIPKTIMRFREEMEVFPATYALPGDYIVVEDLSRYQIPHASTQSIVMDREVTLINFQDIADIIRQGGRENFEIKPWGWNHTLRRRLLKAGVEECLLKTENEIDTLRTLSHRRTAIQFQESLSKFLPDIGIIAASEFYNAHDAMSFFKEMGDSFFKMPWSSSGRGVIHASGVSEEKLFQWLDGCVRKQGSVMGEPAYRKILDFATEWNVSEEGNEFLGLSLFKTSKNGRYEVNRILSQDDINYIISASTEKWGNHIIEAQRKVLAQLCSGRYSGPVGIDMLSTHDGDLVPCVELNFRQTMGMAALIQSKRKGIEERNI